MIGKGTLTANVGDLFEIEKNNTVKADYTVPNLPYEQDTSKVQIDGVVHVARVDIDNLTEGQLRAILSDPNVQIIKKTS